MSKVHDYKAFPFQFVGKGKILMDGKEVNAEIQFLGKISNLDRENVSVELIADELDTKWQIVMKNN